MNKNNDMAACGPEREGREGRGAEGRCGGLGRPPLTPSADPGHGCCAPPEGRPRPALLVKFWFLSLLSPPYIATWCRTATAARNTQQQLGVTAKTPLPLLALPWLAGLARRGFVAANRSVHEQSGITGECRWVEHGVGVAGRPPPAPPLMLTYVCLSVCLTSHSITLSTTGPCGGLGIKLEKNMNNTVKKFSERSARHNSRCRRLDRTH
ncbi:hypothetical protein E2C01_025890 [Portunus trituberculatus]|uniref:Uncharacterized protein n=1 Tax=Portunus trituberculatus TaxID=210409 RepID=A0A5B7EGQ6_PORTR|nr:hypothetical protein [Portunus trituberculatus]